VITVTLYLKNQLVTLQFAIRQSMNLKKRTRVLHVFDMQKLSIKILRFFFIKVHVFFYSGMNTNYLQYNILYYI